MHRKHTIPTTIIQKTLWPQCYGDNDYHCRVSTDTGEGCNWGIYTGHQCKRGIYRDPLWNGEFKLTANVTNTLTLTTVCLRMNESDNLKTLMTHQLYVKHVACWCRNPAALLGWDEPSWAVEFTRDSFQRLNVWWCLQFASKCYQRGD